MAARRPDLAAALLLIAAVSLVAVADARPALRCTSAGLRYPFTPGGPKDFGVFKLRITRGTCTTACPERLTGARTSRDRRAANRPAGAAAARRPDGRTSYGWYLRPVVQRSPITSPVAAARAPGRRAARTDRAESLGRALRCRSRLRPRSA
jgi:hypothetical protein